ncbi:cadherin-23-like [Gigantopelta aegis]|uniref:cadherin-23-like n=1 Tax=Gigantopelta aegis TaxID=1735272 RepID=UPI001B88C136|nr:cadherin-23-like [Gigantopelta aegis]
MTIAKRIDCDTAKVKVLNLELAVTDRGGLQANTSFNVTVSDINDNAPTCSSPISRMNITENGTINTVIGTLNCSDIDEEPNDSFILNIVKGNEDSVFKLLASDLNVDGTKIDYESMRDRDFSYTVTIEAIDYPVNGVARTGVTVIIVKILPANEFAPVWVSPGGGQNGTFPSQSLSEISQPGTSVTTFSARDKDMGADGEIRYSIQSVVSDSGKNMLDSLIINEITGKVVTGKALDRDSVTGGTEYIDIVVVARDNGSPSKRTEGRLRLIITNANDNRPEFNQTLFDVMVTCDKTEKETLVDFGVTDADNASSFSYSIKKGQSSVFSIDDSAGALTLTRIPAENDAIKQKAHIMRVVATDDGNPVQSGEAFVVIQFEKCPFSNITTTTAFPTTSTEAAFVYNCSNITSTVRECPSVLQMPLVENWALRSVCGLMAVSMGIMGVLLIRKNKIKSPSLFKQMSRLTTPVIQSDEDSKLKPAWIKNGLPELPASHVAPVDTRAGGILSDLKLESLA